MNRGLKIVEEVEQNSKSSRIFKERILDSVVELMDYKIVNELMKSTEFRQPIYDPHRSIYVLIRKKR